MKRVMIMGAGGHAHVIAEIIEACGDTVVGFLDDNESVPNTSGKLCDYVKYPDCEFVLGIGDASVREKYSGLPVQWYTAVHPSAVVSQSAVIGEGTVIMPNAVINTRAVIGKHCIINTGAIVEHDNMIGDFAHISVGAKMGGTVRIGKASWIGIGVTVSNNIKICDDCIIGAGTVVVKDIDVSGTYFGVPARHVR